ncbi:hypothetical protein U9M48_003004 [Paspalum notatum var. saurae]|uniref:Uncharacterized protein n=1 Tax=Paspalum notatum var. saurae TaxID=547442 RepID=A0AAQ3PSI8_PASNO
MASMCTRSVTPPMAACQPFAAKKLNRRLLVQNQLQGLVRGQLVARARAAVGEVGVGGGENRLPWSA